MPQNVGKMKNDMPQNGEKAKIQWDVIKTDGKSMIDCGIHWIKDMGIYGDQF